MSDDTDLIHTQAIIMGQVLCVIFCWYLKGVTMAQYLSSEIAHRLIMLAVQHIMSREVYIVHNTCPNIHLFNTCNKKQIVNNFSSIYILV